MSIDSSKLSVSEPAYFHREYENDLGKTKPKSKSAFDQCLRVTQVALPFIALYQPLSQPLALTLGAARTVSTLSQLVESINNGNKEAIANDLFQTIIAVSSLACTIFAHPVGMLINTGHDLLINAAQLVQALQEGDNKKALEISAQILNNTLYLGLFFTGAQEILMASLAVQALLGFYQSSDDFQKGNYLEAAGHFLMAGIRTQQLHTQVSILKLKWEMESFLRKGKGSETQPTELMKNSFESSLESSTVTKESLQEFVKKYNASDEKQSLGWSEVVYAVEKGHDNIALFYLKNFGPIDPEYIISYDRNNGCHHIGNLLVTCVRRNKIDILKAILNMYPSPKRTDFIDAREYMSSNHGKLLYEKRILNVAIEENPNSYDFVKLLLENGASVNISEFYSYEMRRTTPLQTAINRGKNDVAKLLIENNANFDSRWFQIVFEKGNLDLAEYLVKKGADKTDGLFCAVKAKNKQGVALMLEFGADQTKNKAILSTAIEMGDQEIIDMLMAPLF